MRKLRKNIWRDSFLVSSISVMLCYLFYFILDVNVIDYLSKQDSEADVVNYFYAIQNRDSDDKSYECLYEDNVVIFDLQGNNSRRNIADAIKSIEKASPKAIALDIIFSQGAKDDSVDNQYLKDVIKSCKNIYSACRFSDGKIENSFFAQDMSTPSGLANRASHYRPYEIIEGDTVAYLPYLITKNEGVPSQRKMVNFFDKEFNTITISETIIPEDIAGKVVLIGDLSDLRDIYDMPFRINGKWRVPGTVLMAHTISTIINDSWIVKYSAWQGIIIALIFVFSFSLFCQWIEQIEGKGKVAPVVGRMIVTTTKIVLLIVLLAAGYLIFAKYGKLLNLVYAMIAIALSGLATEIIEFTKWSYEKYHNRKNKQQYEEIDI